MSLAQSPAGGAPRSTQNTNIIKKKSWIRRNGITLLLVLMMIVGVGFLAYPSFSNYWNNLHQSRAIMSYVQTVGEIDSGKYKELIDEAQAYNRKLSRSGILWTMTDEEKEEYNSLLDYTGTGIMGYIVIPKINVELPIYHGTDDAVLQTSIGHLEGTSLPVGGSGSHCILSGHRGLPSAKLFTDLDQMVVGDTFSITVLNETLTYEVDQITVIEPTDLEELKIFRGKDYCTLLTCTPYGINTHRLLVRGKRIPNPSGQAQVIAEAIRIRRVYIVPFAAGGAAVALLICLLVQMARVRKRNRDCDRYLGSL